ncbi:MAG: PAS domain-containing protein [Desulfobacteraceae bacterium]
MQVFDSDRDYDMKSLTDKPLCFPDKGSSSYSPPYGDVTQLNRCRLIMDAVGKETLKTIGEHAIDLLDTSVAIYEANGDYAFGMFSSGWCQKMDAASRDLCCTSDNKKALSCGKWLCHENCWNDSAKKAIETGKPTDIACVGGIHLYAEPIFVNQRVVGAVNIGYGDPPKNHDQIKALADLFGVDAEALKAIGSRYESRPTFIIHHAKKLLGVFARMIGEIVEKAETERSLKQAQKREIYLNNVLKAINNVNQLVLKENDPKKLVQKACDALTSTLGYFNAWIALVDDKTHQVTCTGSSGFDREFESFQKQLVQGVFPLCMQRALDSNETMVVLDPAARCSDCLLSREYHGRAAFSRRLAHKDHIFGILSVSVPLHFAHGVQERDLFYEVTEDLSFAFHKIEMEKEINFKNHIIQTLPQPMSIVSRDYHYIMTNKAYSQIYGIDPEQIKDRPILDFINKHTFEQEIKPRLDRCMAGEIVQYEVEVDFPKAGLRWMVMEYSPFRNTEDAIIGVISHGMDITDLKQSEEKLRKTESKTQALLDHSPLCHKIVDLDFNLQYMSANGFKMLGIDPHATVYGKPYPFSFFPDSFQNKMIKKLKEVKETGKTITLEGVAKDSKGNDIWLDSTIVPVLDENGGIDFISTVTADVTWRKKDERERKRLENKLTQAQKMEAIGSLAGGIAHDFNNILFPIVGLSEMMAEDFSEGSTEYMNAHEILKAGRRGSELVKQILAFSRQSDNRPIPVQFQSILKEALKLCRATIPTDIEIHKNIQGDLGFVLANPTQLHQIVMNLMTNAFHAIDPDHGTISVTLSEADLEEEALTGLSLTSGKYAHLTVSDTGTGIQPDVIEKIFDPYFTTKEREKGTGLGLSVVHGIVRGCGGDIKVYSEPGKGTAFDVYIPLKEDAGKTEIEKETTINPTGNERILLVDDEMPIVKMEKTMLERLGYQVTFRTGSIEALAVFKSDPNAFDLVITDMAMPSMTGDQLAAELMAIRPDVPVIIFTGFSERINEKKSASLGIKGYLKKPVLRSDMAHTIRRVLDEAKHA